MPALERFGPTIPFLALAALLASCGEAPTAPPDGGGGLSFRYAGDATGSHRSSGAPVLAASGLPAPGTWAVARPDSLGGLVIAAFEQVAPGDGRLFILQLPDRAIGARACTVHGVDGGCHGRLFLGVDLDDASAVRATYQVVEGTVTLTAVGEARVRGSFALRLLGSADPGGSVVIEAGEMDVPLEEDVTLANGIACLARNLVEGRNGACP